MSKYIFDPCPVKGAQDAPPAELRAGLDFFVTFCIKTKSGIKDFMSLKTLYKTKNAVFLSTERHGALLQPCLHNRQA
jgi:hypothetical protein